MIQRDSAIGWNVLRPHRVVDLERLVDPRVVGQILDKVVGLEHRAGLPPQHRGLAGGDVKKALRQRAMHEVERVSRVHHVVDQQHLPQELAGRKYYIPTDAGYEKQIAERLKYWDETKKKGKE